MSEFDFPLPPPTFEFLVFSLKAQAEVSLGIPVFGVEAGDVNLLAARHAIDMLAMVSEKTKGNLTMEEQRILENSLTELRFRYIQANEQQAKGGNKVEAAASGDASAEGKSPE
ncbi:MAG: DUF1844 domain-containing protein [Bryobacteraceae bacterium]